MVEGLCRGEGSLGNRGGVPERVEDAYRKLIGGFDTGKWELLYRGDCPGPSVPGRGAIGPQRSPQRPFDVTTTSSRPSRCQTRDSREINVAPRPNRQSLPLDLGLLPRKDTEGASAILGDKAMYRGSPRHQSAIVVCSCSSNAARGRSPTEICSPCRDAAVTVTWESPQDSHLGTHRQGYSGGLQGECDKKEMDAVPGPCPSRGVPDCTPRVRTRSPTQTGRKVVRRGARPPERLKSGRQDRLRIFRNSAAPGRLKSGRHDSRGEASKEEDQGKFREEGTWRDLATQEAGEPAACWSPTAASLFSTLVNVGADPSLVAAYLRRTSSSSFDAADAPQDGGTASRAQSEAAVVPRGSGVTCAAPGRQRGGAGDNLEERCCGGKAKSEDVKVKAADAGRSVDRGWCGGKTTVGCKPRSRPASRCRRRGLIQPGPRDSVHVARRQGPVRKPFLCMSAAVRP